MTKTVTIHIGGLHASKSPVVIETILGSCVAVCLYDPVTRVGGMNHILLPGKADLKRLDTVGRYAINAMELLINRLAELGAERRCLVAKAFGGAHVVPAISPGNGAGSKNAAFVLELLRMETIPLVSHDLGGYDTRKIYFHATTGEVLLKRIPCAGMARVQQEERGILERVSKETSLSGDIDLFS